jgi:hypothetical protein
VTVQATALPSARFFANEVGGSQLLTSTGPVYSVVSVAVRTTKVASQCLLSAVSGPRACNVWKGGL